MVASRKKAFEDINATTEYLEIDSMNSASIEKYHRMDEQCDEVYCYHIIIYCSIVSETSKDENASSYVFTWVKDENDWNSDYIAVINSDPKDIDMAL